MIGQFKYGLETLESRRFLSAASLVDGVLAIEGTSANESLWVSYGRGIDANGVVSEDPADSVLHVSVYDLSTRESVIYTERAPGEFKQIRFNGAGGSDTIGSDAQVTVPVGTTDQKAAGNGQVATSERVYAPHPYQHGKLITQEALAALRQNGGETAKLSIIVE